MSMRARMKKHPGRYPNWRRKASPTKLAKQRDGGKCVVCGQPDRVLILDDQGEPHHMLYLTGAHLCPLDPQFELVEPIEEQHIVTMCPACHGAYDAHWRPRWEAFLHEQCLHRILLSRWLPSEFLSRRFLEVV